LPDPDPDPKIPLVEIDSDPGPDLTFWHGIFEFVKINFLELFTNTTSLSRKKNYTRKSESDVLVRYN
jgi:hypothetical protein